jgi:hypothetical protein
MKGKSQFTQHEADEIRRLLRRKVSADRDTQKSLRDKMRKIGFYITDFSASSEGFDESDFDALIRQKRITITDSTALPAIANHQPAKSVVQSGRQTRDEFYVIDLCDTVLGMKASRQHRFPFLKGDASTLLPVDAYYSSLQLVVEYREKQHTEAVRFFDRRITASGVNRGEQRRIYDERRRQVLPKHGIRLVELSYSDFEHNSRKQLLRRYEADLEVVRKALEFS